MGSKRNLGWIAAVAAAFAIGVAVGRRPAEVAAPSPSHLDTAVLVENSPLEKSLQREAPADAAALVADIDDEGDQALLARLAFRAARMTVDQIAAMLTEIRSSNDPHVRDKQKAIEQALMHRWIELDPEGAWRFAAATGDSSFQGDWSRRVFKKLAVSDLASAKTLVASIDEGFARRQALSAIMNNVDAGNAANMVRWVKTVDPNFDEWLGGLDSFAEARNVYSFGADHGIFSRWAQTDPDGAMGYVLGLNRSEERRRGLSSIGEALALTDPKRALAFAKSLQDPSERAATLWTTMQVMAAENPSAAAELVLEMPQGLTQRQVAVTLAGRWAKKDSAAAIAWLESLPDSRMKDDATWRAIEYMRSTKPQVAAGLIAKLPSEHKRSDAMRMVSHQWFKSDPAAAATWLKTQPANAMRDDLLAGAIPHWSQSDPDGAAAFVEEIGIENVSATSLASVASALAYRDFDEALAWVDRIPDPAASDQAWRSVLSAKNSEDPAGAAKMLEERGFGSASSSEISYIARSLIGQDPDTGFAWIASLPEEHRIRTSVHAISEFVSRDPYAAGERLIELAATMPEDSGISIQNQALDIAHTIASNDIAAAMEWASSIPDLELQNTATSAVAKQWALVDPAGASEWIAGLENETVRQSATRDLAQTIVHDDPEAAFQWAETLSNSNFRKDLMVEAVDSWKTHDSKSALRAIDAADISETEKLALIQKIEAR